MRKTQRWTQGSDAHISVEFCAACELRGRERTSEQRRERTWQRIEKPLKRSCDSDTEDAQLPSSTAWLSLDSENQRRNAVTSATSTCGSLHRQRTHAADREARAQLTESMRVEENSTSLRTPMLTGVTQVRPPLASRAPRAAAAHDLGGRLAATMAGKLWPRVT